METNANPSEVIGEEKAQLAELEELLIATEAEKDCALRERDEWRKRVQYLEGLLKSEQARFKKELRKYQKNKIRTLKVPMAVMLVTAFIALLAIVGMMYQMVDPRAGYPVAAAALAICSFAAGAVWERASR